MNSIKEVLEEKGIKQIRLADTLGKRYNMVNGFVENRQQPRLVLCQDKKLNNNGRYFFEDQGEKRRRSSSYGEYF